MREILKKVQKVLNVNKVVLVYWLLGCFITSCATKNIGSTYNLKKYKSKTNKTMVKINSFDKDMYNEPFSSIIVINNIHFLDKNVFNVGLGKHNIKITFPSKLSVYIKNLNIKKGDSIVINTYLKDDNLPNID